MKHGESGLEPPPGGCYRVVHLEDDAADALLVREALEAEGIPLAVELVSNREQFGAALERRAPDLILSDFRLPGFDGLAALHVALRQAPHSPFIFVSGTINEEVAIDSLRGGAKDYVFKNRLNRLGPAVRRALNEAIDQRRRLEAEAALDSERRFLKAMLDSMETGVAACDSQGVLTLFNRALREMHGLPPVPLPPEEWAQHYAVFKPDGRTHFKTDELPLVRALRGESVRNVEALIRPDRLPHRHVLVSARPIVGEQGERAGAVAAVHDVTETRRLEQQLRAAQKMEALGRLAGGVAHDFNNLLTVINGYSEIILGRIEADSTHRSELQEIRRAGERATALTRQLLAFSRQQVLNTRQLNVNTVIKDMIKMLGRLIGEDVTLETRLASRTGSILMDPGQLEQVIMNLAVNSRDAMPQGGTLKIDTTDLVLDGELEQKEGALARGAYVSLSVIDTGCGMDEETQLHIFDPFFTTKKVGEGTGLGLSTVYGIVQQGGGGIQVHSVPGQGSTFRLLFPLISEVDSEPAAAHRRIDSLNGSETILLLEDEPSIRTLMERSLQNLGYRVLSVHDPAEALRLCGRAQPGIDLIVTDVVMPKMSGPEFVAQACAILPGVKVLYMSGYTEHKGLQAVLRSGLPFIQKPFTPSTLVQKVREVMGGTDESAGAGVRSRGQRGRRSTRHSPR